MTTNQTLADRYAYAVGRSVPERDRAGIEAEVRERIADAIDARLAAGVPTDTVERSVLTELGDPERLAADYIGRPLQLIGPKHYLAWWRLLRLLLVTVVPSTFGALILAGLIQHDAVGAVIWSALWISITVGVHLCFWVTLFFVIVDRSPERNLGLDAWSPDNLPELPDESGIALPRLPGLPGLPALHRPPHTRGIRSSRGEVIAVAVLSAVLIAVIVAQQFNPFTRAADGSPIPVLEPGLWGFFLPYFIALIAADVGITLAVHLARRWTWALATAHAVVSLAGTIPLLWLFASGRLVNPAFLEAVGLADQPQTLWIIVIATTLPIAVGVVWDIVDRFRRAYRVGGRR